MDDLEKRAHDVALAYISCEQQARTFVTRDRQSKGLPLENPKDPKKAVYLPMNFSYFVDEYDALYDQALKQLRKGIE